MPLVRIDLPDSLTALQARAAADAVHAALVAVFQVPAHDRFQVIQRHPPGGLVVAPSFLGVTHTESVVLVQISCAPGRRVGVKEALYAQVAQGVAAAAGVRPEDVIVNLLETVRENWSFGNGVAHYAVADRQPA